MLKFLFHLKAAVRCINTTNQRKWTFLFSDTISIRVCREKYMSEKRRETMLYRLQYSLEMYRYHFAKSLFPSQNCLQKLSSLQQTLPIQKKRRDRISPFNSWMLVLEPIPNIEQVVVNACFQATTWACKSKVGEYTCIHTNHYVCRGHAKGRKY